MHVVLVMVAAALSLSLSVCVCVCGGGSVCGGKGSVGVVDVNGCACHMCMWGSVCATRP